VKTFREEAWLVAHRFHWNENASVKHGSRIWTQTKTSTSTNDKASAIWIIASAAGFGTQVKLQALSLTVTWTTILSALAQWADATIVNTGHIWIQWDNG
jgi:hypothetical protein